MRRLREGGEGETEQEREGEIEIERREKERQMTQFYMQGLGLSFVGVLH